MTKERTLKMTISSTITRNHSPYCESTGPMVQEGFVAARVRALQGFSNQAQIEHSPLTPCPGLHVYKSRSPPRPSLALKPVLTGTDMPGTGTIKRFHTGILSKDHRTVISASGGLARSSDAAPSFQLQEQQSSLGPTTPSRLYIRGRGAENPPQKLLFKDTVPSLHAWRKQDHIAAPNKPYGPLSEVDQVDNVPEENSSPSEIAILSPHAIQTDLVEPRATWNFLRQSSDHKRGYSHKQALKPRRSIADKLSSMVERGWVGGDTFGKVYNGDEFTSHTMGSGVHIRDTRLDSRSDSSSETPRLKKVPSYSGSLSVSIAERRSESQHSVGQDVLPHVKQKEPRNFMYSGSQKRRQRQARRSPAINTAQRSSSDFEVRYLKTELATPTGQRRAWTLHHLGRSRSNHSQIQREALPGTWPNDARDYRSSKQDHESTKSPPSHEDATSKSGLDLTIPRDEQLGQDSAALSKVTVLRRSSSNTKDSTRSASRSTSFLKKFPWYKVALVDKQSVVQHLSKGGRGNDETSRSTRPAQHDPTSDEIELSGRVSKSHTFVEGVECGHDEDENAPKSKTPPNQGPLGQQAIDARTPYYKASSEPCGQLMTSPQEMNERQVLEQIRRAPERPQGSRATSLKITEGWLLKNSHQVVKDVIGHAQSPTRTGPSGTQPRDPSRLGSMDPSFESPTSGDVLQSLQPQWPAVKELSRMRSYTSSYADSVKPNVDDRPEQVSSGSGTARPEQESAANPDPSHQLRSKVVNLSPKCTGTRTDSSPASDHKSDQHRPVHREPEGRAKGIKKIQVTVTFDGAEELVIEATLKKQDRQEHWRTKS